MSLSDKKERDKTEDDIIILVNHSRESCEESFCELKIYLGYYIKLFGRKYKIPGCDADEIEQECLFALRYKAIEDFNPERGKFRSFAILCIKRHLFSLIKGNNQLKRRVLNTSLSLDEDRSQDGEELSLVNLIAENSPTVDEQMVIKEGRDLEISRLLSKLSRLEQEVFKLYIQHLHYDEIVEELKKIFPEKRKISKKTADNALQRIRSKAQNLPEKPR